MKVKTCQKGMIVESLQGRDRGKLYAVSELLGDGRVAVVDGVKRPIASPKIKNVKHLRLSRLNVADGGITSPWDKAFDNRLARFLKDIKSGREIKPEE